MKHLLLRVIGCWLPVFALTALCPPPVFCQKAPDIFTALMIHYSRQLDHGSIETQKSIFDAFLQAARAGGDMLPSAYHTTSTNSEEAEDRSSEALIKLGLKDERVIAALVKAVGSTESYVRREAAEALVKLGVEKERGIAALVKAMGSTNGYVSVVAAEALVNLGLKDERVIAALVKAVGSTESYVSIEAVRTLRNLGDKDERVIAALVKAVECTESNVRREAAEALVKLGVEKERGIAALVKAVGSTNSRVSVAAAEALGNLGDKDERVIAALVKAIGSTDSDVRREAAEALVKLGVEKERGIAALVKAVGSTESYVSIEAVRTLRNLGDKDERVIAALVKAVECTESNVRREAAEALVKLGVEKERGIAALVKAVGSTNSRVSVVAAKALVNLGLKDERVIAALVKAVESTESYVSSEASQGLVKLGGQEEAVLRAVLLALGYESPDTPLIAAMGLSLKHVSLTQAQEILKKALTESTPAERVRAARALYRLNGEQADALNTLNSFLEQANGDDLTGIMQAHGEIAFDLRWSASEKDDTALTNLSAGMQKTLASWQDMSRQNVAFSIRELGAFSDIQLAARQLEEERQKRRFPRLRKAYWDYKAVTWPLTYVLLAGLFAGGMLLARPWWVHRLNERLEGGPKVRIPVGVASTELTLAHLLGVGFVRYRPRVLDAWVAHFAAKYEQNLRSTDPVKNSLSYVPLRVKVDNEEKIAVASDFSGCFSGNRACILLWGEGGTGKTTLASQMALWALEPNEAKRLYRPHGMLPVIVRAIPAEDGKKGSALLIAEVRRQLMRLTGEEEALSEELTKRLLVKRRLLLIADSYSEMDAATRALLLPDNPDLPLNALIVTSRTEEPLNNVPKTVIKTGLFKPEQVSEFFGTYLDITQKRALFPEDAFHAAMTQLATLCKNRETTALFAVLFFDWIIENRARTQNVSAADQTDNKNKAPRSLPELVDTYINRLNAPTEKSGYSSEDARAAARFLGWQFLKSSYLPGIVRADSLKAAIAGEEGAKLPPTLHAAPDAMLTYFAKTLHLLQSVDENDGTYKFALDPVAEYLAARWLFRHDIQQDLDRWNTLLTSLELADGYPTSMSGFLLALYDTNEAFGKDYSLPADVQARIKEMYDATRNAQAVLTGQAVAQVPPTSAAFLAATGPP